MKVVAVILIIISLSMIGGSAWLIVDNQPLGPNTFETHVKHWIANATPAIAPWFAVLGLACVVLAIPKPKTSQERRG